MPVPMAVEDRFGKDVDALVAKLQSPQKEIVQALRKLVLETGPVLEEKVKWRNPTYTRKGNVSWLIVYKDHVDLGFFRGTDLPDPKKLLEGTGKGLRHVKIHSLEDVKPKDLKPLIKAAIALDGT